MSWRNNDELKKILVSPDDTILESLPKMNLGALQILIVANEKEQLVGIITDGDIRRALLSGLDLKTPLANVMHSNPITLPLNSSIDQAREIMQKRSIRHIPLLDEQGRVKDLIVWLDCFKTVMEERKEKVVIMAGGKGTRLEPFTKILPKPMVPLGDKPIIEVIMDKFYKQGFSEFILSLGYKAEIIKMYFSETNSRPYKVDFICEEEPLGTAGALAMLKGKIEDTFIVTNCDIILELDFADLLEHHYANKNAITIIGTVKNFTIPYGVLQTDGQDLVALDEKPSFHYLVNTGVYVLDPKVLDLIQKNEFIHMTELFVRVKEKNVRVGVYPHHGSWFDVGQWEDYKNTLQKIGTTIK